MKYGYGIDVGGTTVKIGFFSVEGQLLKSWEIPTDTTDNGVRIASDINNAVNKHIQENNINEEDIVGIGMGVPGPVNNNTCPLCVNLGWKNIDFNQLSKDLFKRRVVIVNDANAAALGENWVGGAKGAKNFVFVTLGTGVGGGIVINGKIIDGTHGAGGEIGHMVINPNETIPCNCGNKGCFEQYASATGLVRKAKEIISASDLVSPLKEKEVSAKDVWDYSNAGDALAKEITHSYCADLGRGLALIAAIVDPEVFVLGGGVSKAGQPLLDELMPCYQQYAFSLIKNTEIRLATLGNDAGMYGAMYRLLTE